MSRQPIPAFLRVQKVLHVMGWAVLMLLSFELLPFVLYAHRSFAGSFTSVFPHLRPLGEESPW